MYNIKIVNLNLIIISASIMCFEIISTRISSVIFVNNYAFIILSLAILGLGLGGIFSHYKIQTVDVVDLSKVIIRTIIFIGLSFLIYIAGIILLNITNPFIYFSLLILPFFFAGIVYSQLYKLFAGFSYLLYLFDLVGAAIGSLGSIFILDYLGASNSVLLLCVLIFCSSLIFMYNKIKKGRLFTSVTFLVLLAVLIIFNGESVFLGRIPIGFFPEKDFYFVYPDAKNISNIEESRWSIYGRSDLVSYTNQDAVKQIFIDGSAGTQMYRFNGNVKHLEKMLGNLLIHHSTSIPFLFLTGSEKNSMLVIGPGGGKEILTGLIESVQNITGVEVNPDFVDIVKQHKYFNGGIYTDFPNVNIEVAEGRHFVKQSSSKYDIICMALPSTEQLQNVDNLASNENFLLTVEAVKDYLNMLTTEGRLIFTVHNRWELIRLIVTALYAFNETGVNNQEALNHFIVLGEEYAPTLVIKKSEFSQSNIAYIENIIKDLPGDLPRVSYLPYSWDKLANSTENILLKTIKGNQTSLAEYIKNDRYDISPVWDDSPYFYKVNRGIPGDYLKLFFAVTLLSLMIILIPLFKIKRTLKNKNEWQKILVPLTVFICIGFGFMILEVSLFQKFILYLGSPTISLSVLLVSVLVGMGTGSYFGSKIFAGNPQKRISVISILVVVMGLISFVSYPWLLNKFMVYGQSFRSIVSFFLILPLGFLLGIPFPSGIQMLKESNLKNFIPWIYGVNGILTVLGSIAAVIISMTFGFNITFLAGITAYFVLFLLLNKRHEKAIKKLH